MSPSLLGTAIKKVSQSWQRIRDELMELEIDFDDRMGGFKDEKILHGETRDQCTYPAELQEADKKVYKKHDQLKEDLLQ